jgi:hypothetical protein
MRKGLDDDYDKRVIYVVTIGEFFITMLFNNIAFFITTLFKNL